MNSKNNWKKVAEINKKFILEKIALLNSQNACLPKMPVIYRSLQSGIFSHELKDPEFYGVPDDPYTTENDYREGFVLEVFDNEGTKRKDGSVISMDLCRSCVVFDISSGKICHASFGGDKNNPLPIYDSNGGYGGYSTSDWITYYDRIMEKLK